MSRRPAGAVVSTWHGAATVVLRAGDYEAVVVPELSMLVASLRWRGREHVALPGGLRAYRAGHTTGIPLLHPWANRLSRHSYSTRSDRVSLRGLPLHADANGLPIHGTMTARPGWDVVAVGSGETSARVEARFPFGDHPDLLASFPFPHDLGVEVRLGPRGLQVRTSVTPTGRSAVPISFGWHPYWRLGSPRARWTLTRPPAMRLALDRRGIPTGRRIAAGGARAPLGVETTYDDLYALARLRTFVLADGTTAVRVAFDEGYPFAQVYSPPSAHFCAIEPMTAPTNALVTGDHPMVRPGATFRASFRASVVDLDH